jgi:hypothetical protein
LAATAFDLVSRWQLAAPLERVWSVILATDEWPEWWRAVKHVEKLSDGAADGVWARRRITWSTALPYTLAFDVEVTRIEPMRTIEARATGELNGLGLWTLEGDDRQTRVRYDWRVELAKPWMRFCAPLLRPAFAWNHQVVLGWGETDIRKRLGIG